MFVVTVHFRVQSEHAAEFRAAVLRQAANSLAREECCRQFDVCFDPEDPRSVFLYELYDDRDAFDQHVQSEHFRNFDATVRDWVDGKQIELWQRANPSHS